MTAAYAYTRVSSSQQDTDGKSGLSRQLDSITEFLKNHPEHSLSKRVYSDKSSGYYGMNTRDDAGLGTFLNDCKSGLVKPGDMLCVELIDRISRLPPDDARQLFQRILGYGVKVAIVRWGIVIDKTQNQLDLAGDLLLTVGFHLAHMESQQKSKRIQAAKDKNLLAARAGEKILFSGRSVPLWLELNQSKTEFIPKPDEVAKINKIFEMKLSGLGAYKIMTLLAAKDELLLGSRKLRTDSINRLLKNRRLIGEYQPQTTTVKDNKRVNVDNGAVITNYYPTVVKPELFNAAQASFSQSAKGMAARTFKNVFSGLMKCSNCGHAVTQKASYSNNTVYRVYYSCTGRSHRKVCDRDSQHMLPIREKLLAALHFLNYSPVHDKHSVYNDLFTKRHALEHNISQLNKQNQNYALAIANADNEEEVKTFLEYRTDIQHDILQLQQEIEDVNNTIATHENDPNHKTTHLDLESESERIRLNTILRQNIITITLDENGVCIVRLKNPHNGFDTIIINTTRDTEDKDFLVFTCTDKEQSKPSPDNPSKATG